LRPIETRHLLSILSLSSLCTTIVPRRHQPAGAALRRLARSTFRSYMQISAYMCQNATVEPLIFTM
jgi:hypothetical protein